MSIDALASRIVGTHGGRETEQNWEKLDALYKEFVAALAGSTLEDVIQAVKKFKEVLQNSVRRGLTGQSVLGYSSYSP